jgi:hypothetical protein
LRLIQARAQPGATLPGRDTARAWDREVPLDDAVSAAASLPAAREVRICRAAVTACHALGHTLGLRHATVSNHPNQWDGSCMRTGVVPGPTGLRGFDIQHLEDCYPHHPFDEPPLCRQDD